MNRRHFLTAAAAAAPVVPSAASGHRIHRITLATIEGRFHRFVAMNSYDKAPKGHTYNNTLVRIRTDQGVEGAGVMHYPAPDDAFRQALRKLIGADPMSLYDMTAGRIVRPAAPYADVHGRYRHLDGPLFDLVGKVSGKPAWKLIGESVRDRIEVYDGQLYFSDVWFRDRGVRAVLEEADEAMKKGYTGVKLKVGRGAYWMEREAGLRRDIEVVKAVRKLCGPKVKVLVDANNAHANDFERAWRFINETAPENVFWHEEMFPEDVQLYTELRSRMAKAGIRSWIADGESVRDSPAFEPYLKPVRLVDVLQMDIRGGGFIDNAKMGRMAEEAGGTAVPHNWGSQVGGLMALQLAKAVKSVTAAEDDRSTCDVIVTDGYDFRNGAYTVPDKPGMAIHVDNEAYDKKYRAAEVVIA